MGAHRKLKVLLLEDDADLAFLLEYSLGRAGYQCEIAKTVAEARALVATHPFCFLLLDLCLPDGNGVDILPQLDAGPNRNTAVIVSSGTVGVEARHHPRIARFFQKPYDFNDLLDFVKRLDES